MSAAILLLSRMLVVAAIVVAVSAVVSRSGPFIGAMVAVIPVSAGPAYLFLAMDHGPDFIARSAITSILGVGAAGPFVLGHGIAARRLGTPASAAAGLAAWAFTLALMHAVTAWTLASAAPVALVLLLVAIVGTRRARREAVAATVPSRRIDLVLRAAAVMSVVAAVTIGAELLGPGAAGYAAMLPVVFVSLVLVLQPRVGGPAMAGLLSHAVVGLVGYVPAFAAIHHFAPRIGSAWSLAAGLAITLAANGALILARRSR